MDASLRPCLRSHSASASFQAQCQKAPTQSDARPCAEPQRPARLSRFGAGTRLARAVPRARPQTPKLLAAPATNGSLRAAPRAPRPRRGPRKQNGSRVNTLLLRRAQEGSSSRKDELGRPRRPGPHLHQPLWRAGLALGRRSQEGRLAQNKRHPVDGAGLDRPGDEGLGVCEAAAARASRRA